MDNKLTPEQIKNWRNVLFTMFGGMALILSDAEIQRYRDMMQKKADALEQKGDQAVPMAKRISG